jgi:hypothetical protein
MKFRMLSMLCVAAAACGPSVQTGSSGGDVELEPVPASGMMANAYGTSMPLATRMAYVDRYVESVEAGVAGVATRADNALTLVQRSLTPDAFANVTDERFERMDSYYAGTALKRIRMIPMPPETATEEFYFNDGKLVYVYYEPDGASKPEPHPEVSGQKFYFGAEGLMAWVLADGTQVRPNHPDFRKWSAHLQKEAAAFARGP